MPNRKRHKHNNECPPNCKRQYEPPTRIEVSRFWVTLSVIALVILMLGLIVVSFVLLDKHASPPPLQFFMTSILSVLVFVAIVFQVIIYFKMSAQNESLIQASEDSAKVARDAFYIGERAHFGILNMRWQNTGRQNETSLLVTFLNGGKSPAWHFHTSAVLHIGANFIDKKVHYLQMRKDELSRTFIPAGEEITINYVSKDFPQLSDLYGHFEKNHADKLFIQFHALYQDFNWRTRGRYKI
jgi:heme/copper-type cytochrome/quinol oxidase subunit 2